MPGPCADSASLTASASYTWIMGGVSFGVGHVFCAKGKARNGLDFARRRCDQGQDCHVYLEIGDAAKGWWMGACPARSGSSSRDAGSGSKFAQSASVVLKDLKETRRSQSLWRHSVLRL